ncbi:hypothetical protein BGZ76_001125 [Entomortierella beljakovae]|nr:hypothetical protein BGZ76_001125 [Entomortierella beljakovae]
MSSQPCRFFLAGNCRNGARCRFYHEGFSSLPREILVEEEEEDDEDEDEEEEEDDDEDEEGEELVSISPGHMTENETTHTPASNPSRPAYAATRPCHWYMNGYCLRGDSCWFSHDRSIINGTRQLVDPNNENEADSAEQSSSSREQNDGVDEEDQKCAICFEIPKTFGLLVSCNHPFCLTCIRTWRSKETAADLQPHDGSNTSVTKACPNCRTQSLYVVPSSFFPSNSEEKEIIIHNYKEVVSRKTCKYFAESGERHWCPFGDGCFFAHLDENGEKCKVNPESDPRRRRNYVQRRLAQTRRALMGMRREILYTLRPAANPTEEDLIGLQTLLEQLSHYTSSLGEVVDEEVTRSRPRNSTNSRRNRRNIEDYSFQWYDYIEDVEPITIEDIEGLAQLEDDDSDFGYEYEYDDDEIFDYHEFHESWLPHDT